MEAAIYGIIGVVLGGVISAITTFVGNRQQLELRKIELAEQGRRDKERAKEARRKEKLERYANFLASYWIEEGFLFDVVDQLSVRQTGWSKRIAEIIDAEEHKKAVARLNEGVAWIGLICENDQAEEMALRVSHSFDRLVTELIRIKEIAKVGGDVNLDTITERFEKVRMDLRQLSKRLREDLHVE